MEQNLRRIPFFSELPSEILEAISKKLRLEHYRKDDVVFVQGGLGNAMYLIESGQVKVVSESNGEEKILAYLGPASFFGEMALLLGERRSATVKVVIDADLWVLHKSDLDELLLQYPTIALTFSRELSRRLSFTDHHPALREEYNIVAVIGGAVLDLARSLVRQTGQRVIVFDLNIPAALPTSRRDGVAVQSGADLNSEGLAEMLSTSVQADVWVLMSIPPRETELTLKALELADVTVQIGTPDKSWRAVLGRWKHWIVPDDPAKIDQLARRIARRIVGLALSSGNARGIAHIGVLRALEQERIPVDMIAGTSAGALFGALYAAGLSLDTITGFALELQRKVALRSGLWDFLVPPRSGLIRGNRTLHYLRQFLGEKTFAELKMPLYVVATDILTGAEVVFDSGPVAEAVRASISVIGVFAPAQVQGRFLIDGGAVNPIPTSVLAQRGADVIIASSVIPSLEDRLHRQTQVREGRSPSMLGVLVNMMEIMESEIIRTRMNPANVVITPAVEIYSATEFDKAAEFIRLGEEAAHREMERIKHLVTPRPQKSARGR